MKNSNIYAGYRYPAQIISHAVWLYHRFTLSFRDIEELLAARQVSLLVMKRFAFLETVGE
jgi:putative transposase